MRASAPPIDDDAAYRACSGREARFDGRLYLAVTSTGIYCRPSCPARTPRREHCRFFATAAACVAAGYRACKRCRPDALPGTRDWDASGDLTARALRLIRDGALDTAGGVAGLAARLHVSERQLRRVLVEATGASPVQLAATRRAALARQLMEQTALPLAEVAFAAGFSSIRRFNDTMRAEFGVAPSMLPRRRGAIGDPGERAESSRRPRITLRLRTRAPFGTATLRTFLANHAVAGLERTAPETHERVVPVPGGYALARVDWPRGEAGDQERPGERGGRARAGERHGDISVVVHLDLPRLDDLMPAIARVRRMLDLDADPALVDEALAADTRLAPLVTAAPGMRIPGSVAPHETALMIVLGQQVSVRAALTVQARLAAEYGRALPELASSSEHPDAAPRGSASPAPTPWMSPPDPAAIADDGVARVRSRLGVDGNRATALVALAAELAAPGAGTAAIDLGQGADRAATRARLLALPRVGPWTADLIAMRCLGDPDVFVGGDLIARRALGALVGTPGLTPRAADRLADAWRPWRSYALMHLWRTEYHRS
ncbi:DNA-3-methyladenine glycosylase [Pseudoclavibacter endophyticus]|uniref:DNA-3-methyladenine glycosylase II n=1 Tax=Pseudoclavibacter endophyticus TaxID=1778590 RepID=A0A6H9WH52_9MICO|nr:AlkA N-terminal domain-containing protein [Pseudoclavibacter endophyticus]KAB1646891.1 DNA-3-methyladenine glycosylase 2 family protein [Pseudoclavibacter endophyticus]GGA74659.1 DNA-3-methyladenine glycosylase [Pseudoclavibacter endophyticus]